jgi:RNA polymerase sigma-70 factor (ECF subfamily)
MVNEVRASHAAVPVEETDFWGLYDRALPSIYGYFLRRADSALAEDLTQEVLLQAARTFRSGDGAKVTMPWLMTVARSRLVDHHRAEARRNRKLVLAWSTQRSETTSAEADFDAGHLTAETERALASLPAAQRAALVLRHLDDLSVAEVAEALGRSVRATESLLARARQSFRSAMEVAPS